MKRLFLLGMILMLAGCTNTVVTAARTVYHRNGIISSWHNINIKHRADVVIRRYPALLRANVDATVFDHDVLLTGQVPTAKLRRLATQVIKNVDGVDKVINYLRVGPNVSSSVAIQDHWITAKIKSKIVANDTLRPSQVSVTTENREVFLFGIMTKAHIRIAIWLAQHTDGVKRVIPVFRVVHVERAYHEADTSK